MFPKPEADLQDLLDELMACPHEKHHFMTPNPVPGVLNRIGERDSLAALPWLFRIIHSRVEKNRAAAERAVGALLPQLEAQQILELEMLVRSSWLRFHDESHSYRTTTEQGARLATLDSSGWIREKAVLALLRSGDTGALPFVLLRSNDWVEQVRRAAEQWFAANCEAITMEQLADSLPILAALSERTYGGASKIVKSLLERLAQPYAAPALMESLPKSNARTRRLLFTLLAQSGALQDRRTQSVLLKHPDPIFGVLLLKQLRLQDAELPADVVNQALSAKSALVRRYALYCLSEEQISQLMPLVSQAAFDSAQGVRNFAQYHLMKRITAEELQSRYAEVLLDARARNALRAACIFGFHEAGGKWEASHYLDLVQHRSMQVRVAVLRSFAAARFEEALPSLKTVLASDDGPSLGNAALTILRRHPHALTLAEIEFLLRPDHSARVRLRAFGLLCLRGKWEKLPALFELVQDPADVFVKHALSRLSAWMDRYNEVQTQPTSVQVEKALAALDRTRDRLDSRFRAAFRSLLHSVVPR